MGGLTLGLSAAAGALAYLADTQRAVPRHVDRLSRLATDEVLQLDEATRANLELERTLSGGRKKGTLLALLDRTATAPGGRRLAEWLRYPLLDPVRIGARLDAVEELVGSSMAREDLAAALRPVADLERLLSRLALGQGNARDLRALAGALLALPALADHLEARAAPLLAGAGRGLRGLEPLAALLDRAVAEEPPVGLKEGGLVRRGFSAELDEHRRLAEDGKGTIARLEAKERERTGIGSLKVRFNRVFGYYLEVTKPNLHLVPADCERKQTTVGGERFVTAGAQGVRGAGARRPRSGASRSRSSSSRSCAQAVVAEAEPDPDRGRRGGDRRRAPLAGAAGGRARLRPAGGGLVRGAGDRGRAPPGGGGAPARGAGRLRAQRRRGGARGGRGRRREPARCWSSPAPTWPARARSCARRRSSC